MEHIFSAIKSWVEEFDIDGLRLDVAYCLTPEFLKQLRQFTDGLKEEFFLLGETLHGDYNQWMNPQMLHSVTNYELHKGLFSSFNSMNMFEIVHSLLRQFGPENWTLYKGQHLLSFVDNHDVSRIASNLTNEKHLPLIYAMAFGMPGIPCVYYGSEWGAKAAKQEGDPALRACFEKPVEKNISAQQATIYAKWEDETAPVPGEATYQSAYRTLLNYIIRKSNLLICVPILEEGSGVKQADYILMPDDGDIVEGKAQIEVKDGRTEAKIWIKDNYKGSVSLTVTDNAGNTSAEKIITSMDGGVIVEDSAPDIRFSSKDGKLSDSFDGPVSVNVNVNDKTDDSRVAGGLANISYQLDKNDKKDVSDEKFKKEIVESYNFAVLISKGGEHTLTVTAIDNAGNKNVQQKKIKIDGQGAQVSNAQNLEDADGKKASPNEREPQTGDSSKVELYATIAMIAGFLYVFLLFVSSREEEKEKK